jgi:hypothetical protein
VYAVIGVLCIGLTILTAFALRLSAEKAILLAPVLVFGSALILGVLLVLGRAFVDSVRASHRPRLVIGSIVGVILLVAVLTVLGVELPRE